MFNFPVPPPPIPDSPPDLNPVLRKLVDESTETFRRRLGLFAVPEFVQQYRDEITRVARTAWKAGWSLGLNKAFAPERERSEAGTGDERPEERQHKSEAE